MKVLYNIWCKESVIMKQMLFADNLKNLRKSKKLSQQQIAGGTGIARSMISDYENGKKEPTLSAVVKLAEFFGLTLDEMVYGK
jgi:transcriptional regulator with XRE-family HTH domain